MDAHAKEAMEILAYMLLNHKKSKKSAVIYQGLAEYFPWDGRIRLGWAMAQMESGRLMNAFHILKKWPKEALKPEEYHLLKSKVLARMGEHDQAKETLHEYLKRKTNAYVARETQ
jgi:hypothetical protein